MFNSIILTDTTHFKPMKEDNFPGKPIKTIKSWMSCAKVKLTPGSSFVSIDEIKLKDKI